jgi:phage terminase large subunit-like protein
MTAFTNTGDVSGGSPDRVDALMWVITEPQFEKLLWRNARNTDQ